MEDSLGPFSGEESGTRTSPAIDPTTTRIAGAAATVPRSSVSSAIGSSRQTAPATSGVPSSWLFGRVLTPL